VYSISFQVPQRELMLGVTSTSLRRGRSLALLNSGELCTLDKISYNSYGKDVAAC